MSLCTAGRLAEQSREPGIGSEAASLEASVAAVFEGRNPTFSLSFMRYLRFRMHRDV
jgi:hypothetical protein